MIFKINKITILFILIYYFKKINKITFTENFRRSFYYKIFSMFLHLFLSVLSEEFSIIYLNA